MTEEIIRIVDNRSRLRKLKLYGCFVIVYYIAIVNIRHVTLAVAVGEWLINCVIVEVTEGCEILLLAALTHLHLLCLFFTHGTLVEYLIVQGGCAVLIRVFTSDVYAECRYAELLHAVIHIEELVVGKLHVFEIGIPFHLFGLGVLDLAVCTEYKLFNARKEEKYRVENSRAYPAQSLLSACKEVGDVDCEYSRRYDHKPDLADQLDNAESDNSSDEAAADSVLSVLEELNCAEGEA